MDEIIAMIDDLETLSMVKKIIPFHGYLSSGAFIGMQMLQIAKKLLDIKEGDKIYVTCETSACVPDPFQIICGSTIGNKGLKILDYGKMAVTINKAGKPGDKSVEGIRIFLDQKKTAKYPVLHAWYMNERKVPHEEVLPILIEAGEYIYTWEFVDVPVPVKIKKNITICEICGESFIRIDDEDICQGCSTND